MDRKEWEQRLAGCEKILIGLGEEWMAERGSEKEARIIKAYGSLYNLIKDKDYFIITRATDAIIYDTVLGSRREMAASSEQAKRGTLSCGDADPKMIEKMDQIFPQQPVRQDFRWDRIVAPWGNETWRQCSKACTRDIWEPGEIPDDRCPHCGAPLTGNTRQAQVYIEEGYLPQWERYTRWLAGTLNQDTLILELGVGFEEPGVIRFPFEKTTYFNRKAFLCRVNKRFPQTAGEIKERAVGIGEDSLEWIVNLEKSCHL